MDIRVYPSQLKGRISAIPSKSAAHRAMLTAALADMPSCLLLGRAGQLSVDIEATASCIRALGGKADTEADRIMIQPISQPVPDAELDCGESGSTLRFILPVAAGLGKGFSLAGHGRLTQRPVEDLCLALETHGCVCDSHKLPFSVKGRLRSGDFAMAGNISSQYISGLLLAAPVLSGDSRIILTSPLQSAGYVDMTLKVMEDFGAEVTMEAQGFAVKATGYTSPHEYEVEGDWSNAAFWLTANMLGADVQITGLNRASAQPDKAVENILRLLGKGVDIDVSQCPDLLPVLTVAAACNEGKTEFVNGARLRLKESDRISAVAEGLQELGIKVQEHSDGLTVYGGNIRGGTVRGYNDHRLVMSWAVAALQAESPVIIRGAEAVNKSYPDFWKDLESLGGRFDVI